MSKLALLWKTLKRGLGRRCPRCGHGKLFDGWYTPRAECDRCGLDFDALHPHTWAFMYISTAALTGVVVLVMLSTNPHRPWLSRGLLFVAAVVLIVGSLPYRKGVAIALDYLVEAWEQPAPNGFEESDGNDRKA